LDGKVKRLLFSAHAEFLRIGRGRPWVFLNWYGIRFDRVFFPKTLWSRRVQWILFLVNKNFSRRRIEFGGLRMTLVLMAILLGSSSINAFAKDCSYEDVVKFAQKKYPTLNFQEDAVDHTFYDESQFIKERLNDPEVRRDTKLWYAFKAAQVSLWISGGHQRFSVTRKDVPETEMDKTSSYVQQHPKMGTATYYCNFDQPDNRTSCTNVKVTCLTDSAFIFSPNKTPSSADAGQSPGVPAAK
jgi:hypothetical protein